MDSLDYEALRCANVSEISNAIKERGMNNMLADRIKDYLLSIRGLGLKSVECVRLLLHQLAFPVDTNFGRIAVRLGSQFWSRFRNIYGLDCASWISKLCFLHQE